MELNQKNIDVSYKLMEMTTKGYHWYHDTPEQPFVWSEGSIWLINPDTKEWMLELQESGDLLYYYKTRDTFSNYLNMEESDFQSFIKIWVEDALKRGVVSTLRWHCPNQLRVEDALKRGVVSTRKIRVLYYYRVEDVLEKGKQIK